MMLNFVVGLVIFVGIVLLIARQRMRQPRTFNGITTIIPGLSPTDPKEGNFPDILKTGSLSNFLRDIHETYGNIVSFWEGTKFSVSTAAPNLYKEQSHLQTLPDSFNDLFRPLCGNDCFAIGNSNRALQFRNIYDPFFNHTANSTFFKNFSEVANDYLEKWKLLNPDDHIPLLDTMLQATMTALTRSLFGDYFKDSEKIDKFRAKTDEIFKYLQAPPEANSEEDKVYKENIEGVRNTIKEIIEQRRLSMNCGEDQPIFIDVLLQQEDMTDDQRIGDALVFLSAGYVTTGQLLTNIIYLLTLYEEAQESLYQELVTVLGEEKITQEKLPNLKYTRQVINETMRFIPGADFLFRVADTNMKVGGYTIPQGTNLYQTLCVSFDDPYYFPDPDRFDPDRFSEKKCKKQHEFAFKPFGFAGSRQCPGANFTYMEATVLLSNWCRQFEFRVVPGQSVNYIHGLATRLADEVWVTLVPRNQ